MARHKPAPRALTSVMQSKKLAVWGKSIQMERHIDGLLVAAFVVLAAIPVVINLFQPLWFDEVWRAHIISVWRLHRIDGEAPLPLLFMLLTKAVTLVYNNEVTQRLVYIVFGLALIPVSYLFGRKIRGRRYGLLLAGAVPFTYYYLEYISQDKAFLADITLTVLFLWVFHSYMNRTIRLRWFMAYCLVYMLASPSSMYLFLAAGIWQLSKIWRHKVAETWQRLLSWSLPVGLSYVVYYVTFLKPQITPGLLTFWQINEWRGQSAIYVVQYITKHVISTFGVDVTNIWPQVGINFPVDATGFLSFAPMSPSLARWTWLFAAFVALWFVIGVVSMIRRGFGFIPLVVLVTWMASLALSYFAIAPFGNNRANIFLFGVMAMIAWLGLYEILAKLWGQRTVLAQGLFIGVIFAVAWFFPLTQSINRMLHARGEFYLDGMPSAARMVRAQSQPNDLIINYHFMNETSFGYYYNYDSAIRRLNKHPSEHIWYDRREAAVPNTPVFFDQLSKDHPVVWVVWGSGYGHDPTDAARASYNVSEVKNYPTVSAAKLTAKE